MVSRLLYKGNLWTRVDYLPIRLIDERVGAVLNDAIDEHIGSGGNTAASEIWPALLIEPFAQTTFVFQAHIQQQCLQ